MVGYSGPLRPRPAVRGLLPRDAARDPPGGRTPEPPAVPRLPDVGRATREPRGRVRARPTRARRDRAGHGRPARGGVRRSPAPTPRPSRGCSRCTRRCSRRGTWTRASTVVDDRTVRLAFGPSTIFEEGDDHTWLAGLGGDGDRAIDALARGARPAGLGASRCRPSGDERFAYELTVDDDGRRRASRSPRPRSPASAPRRRSDSAYAAPVTAGRTCVRACTRRSAGTGRTGTGTGCWLTVTPGRIRRTRWRSAARRRAARAWRGW